MTDLLIYTQDYMKVSVEFRLTKLTLNYNCVQVVEGTNPKVSLPLFWEGGE